MSPVPAGYEWALSTVGSKRHARIKSDIFGVALCSPSVVLGLPTGVDQEWTDTVMSHPACKRCLQRTGGVE